MGSFSTPLSGLTAAQSQLQSVSNNLANIDTAGFKDQTVNFSDLFQQTGATNGSGDPLQTGSGVKVASTDSDFSEGNINATGTASNMALSGNGFFVTQNSSGLYDYTRAGDFTTNKFGQLNTANGELVLGYPAANGVVNTAAALQPLNVGTGVTTPAVASTTIGISANLDAAAATGATASSTLPFIDSLGNSHALSITYTLTAPNTWTYSVTMPTADLTPGAAFPTTTPATVANPVSLISSGTLVFNTSGILTSTYSSYPTAVAAPTTPATEAASLTAGIALPIPPVYATIPVGTITSTFADGAAPMTGLTGLNWSLLTAGSPTITQTATASATSAVSTNGFASGTLTGYSVGPDGTIAGVFSSGQTLDLGQVAVATFSNNEGLIDVGNNNYQSSAASGPSVIGIAGTGGRGTVVGGSVEQSNVNIATEFAKLIIAQQAYSANAKTITTFNQVSQATIAIIQ